MFVSKRNSKKAYMGPINLNIMYCMDYALVSF